MLLTINYEKKNKRQQLSLTFPEVGIFTLVADTFLQIQVEYRGFYKRIILTA